MTEIKVKAEEEYKKNSEIRRSLLETNQFREKHITKTLEQRKTVYEKELAKFRKEIESDFKQTILERANILLEKHRKKEVKLIFSKVYFKKII